MKNVINTSIWFIPFLKLDLKVKLSLLFILTSLCSMQAFDVHGQDKISLDIESGTVEDFIIEIENTTNYSFIYKLIDVDIKRKVSVKAENEDLSKVLEKVFKNTKTTYNISKKRIFLIERKKIANSGLNSNIQLQENLKGTVVDESGLPISGVNVIEKGTSNGTFTDMEGNFKIKILNQEAILSFSYIGFIKQDIKVGSQTSFEIVLKIDESKLNEVMIIGYGKQKRSDVTGAIASVSSQDISEIPTTNPFQALKGKVAGVDVFNNGNEPGSNVRIRIRGQRSIGASNEPLVVLDGIPFEAGLNEISPNDILSIEILKDASATAIYGSRASNGVILVTSKKGTRGKTSVSVSNYYGITSVINRLDLMNGEEFAQLRREANRTVSPDGQFPADSDIFDNIALESLSFGRNTDWQKLIYGNGYKQNHQISISGGSDKSKFYTSLNYFNEEGIVDNSKFERGSLRINFDHKINNKINFGVTSFISRSKQNITQIDLFDNVLRLNPLGIPFDEEGNILFRPTNDESQRVNPFSDLANSVNDNFNTKIFASLFAEYEIIKNLKYRLNLGPDLQFNKAGFFYGSNTTNNQGGSSTAGIRNNDIISMTVENILNYNSKFDDKNIFDATLVQSYQNQIEKTDFTNVAKIPFDSQTYNNLGSASEVRGVGSNFKKWRLLSYMARLNYQYDNRYLLTLTGRADGSSRFAEGNKWGFFPSAAVAWKLSEEEFFNMPNKAISDLKFRISYGETGNTAIQPFQTFSFLDRSLFAFGNDAAPGFVPGSISNPDLRWETTKEWNFGLDFEVWNSKINGSINYYRASTEDLLLPRSLPSSSGFTNVLQNIGSTTNRGLEINISLKDIISSNDFKWEADLNFSTNENKITEIFGDGQDDIGNQWFIGQPIDVFYDFKKIGIWQTNEADEAASLGFQPGQIKIKDANLDGILNADDRVIIGTPTPDWIGGLTNRFYYRGFMLSVVLHVRQNNLTSSEFYSNNNRLAGRYNNLDVDYWTPENPTDENPRPNVTQESVFLGSTLTYKDVSFVRFRNIVLSYSLPENLLKRLNIQDLTFNFTAENPFTITNYEGFDPEFESNGERALYPSTKTFALGLNINF